MKISTKLGLFYISALAVFCLLASGVTLAMRSLASGYDEVLTVPVRQIDEARVIQVDFKKQVQEWKDILLRGHNSDDLVTYTSQFHHQEQRVRAGTNALAEQMRDEESRQLLEQFLAAHAVLSQRYQQAYEAYVANGNFDFKAADKIVRGQDRAPTDLFDKIVARLDALVQRSVLAQKRAARHARNAALAFSAGLLGLIGIAGLLLVRNVVGRLARLKSVSDRLAAADISGLTIDVSGKDEIAAFAGSMRGVHAAIEELLEVASMQTTAKS